jgi:N12 class adenine-specific DNA methylase
MTNFTFNAANDIDGLGGPQTKYSNNIAALRVLRQIEAESRPATSEEKDTLSQYVGWGDSQLLKLAFPYGVKEGRPIATELESLNLNSDELRSLQASSLNAHYTSLPVIRAIYEGLEHAGIGDLDKLRILEPAAGIGHFIGAMPSPLLNKSEIVGVELDLLSSRIAQILYPDAKILSSSFEKVKVPSSYFDLIISNVPFGDYPVADQSIKQHYLKASIHDYYFAKSLHLVRPGGLIAFITSRFTMDKKDHRVRSYLAEHADLLAAVRLPNTAFKKCAGTEVVTDVIILRRKERPDTKAARVASWINLDKLCINSDLSVDINTIFANTPSLMLGIPSCEHGMYRNEEFTLRNDGSDLYEILSSTLKSVIPAGIITQSHTSTSIALSPLGDLAGKLEDKSEILQQVPISSQHRASMLFDIYQSAKQLINLQVADASDDLIVEAQKDLNYSYDKFKVRFGYINSQQNLKCFKSNNSLLPFLCALEESKGKDIYAKAPIFFERTIRPHIRTTNVNTSQEALLICLDNTGHVDINRIAQLANKEVYAVAEELRGIIFNTPSGKWVTADEYLSGNVRYKLREAEAAAAIDSSFMNNVEALKAVQPKPIGPGEICARLGASWIPDKIINQFARALVPDYSGKVTYIKPLAQWKVEKPTHTAASSIESKQKWGTRYAGAISILEDILNLKRTVVYNDIGNEKQINQIETTAAQAKVEAIKERFSEWIWEDTIRTQQLTETYNEVFNSIRERHYNGQHLSLPGASTLIELRPHQKDAVWRILQSKATLLAHCTGAGKTLVCIAAAVEMKRLGLSRKSLITVPKNVVNQWGEQAQLLYPGIRVLTTDTEDFTPAKRGELMSRIATGNWDLIIIPHPSFKLLPVKAETLNSFIKEEIFSLKDYIQQLRWENEDENRVSIKEMEKALKRFQARLENTGGRIKHDSEHTITWEELGIDSIFVDEADEFKNLYFTTKMTRISGLPNTESQRAFDMFVKLRLLFRECGRVVFATATPVSNTLAEIFTMMRYLQLELLEDLGLEHFDSWAQTFADTTTGLEMRPDGSGFRMNTRFGRFVNLPELSSMWRQVMDVRNEDQLNLETPKLMGGGPIIVNTPASKELKTFIATLAKRADIIKEGSVHPSQDNMLKITSEGRKAALDMRLIYPNLPEDPNCKINALVDRIVTIYNRTNEDRGTQLVFCDLSTPKGKGKEAMKSEKF